MLKSKFTQRLALALSMFVFAGITANAQSFSEGFDVAEPLPAGWVASNQSATIGTTGWFQGNSTVFPSQTGAITSYIGANFNNTTGNNTISNWLLTPNRTFNNGDIIRFWTRTVTNVQFADRLEVRMSATGASTNVGTGPTAVGDFTSLLLTINPTLTTSGYPNVWTEQTITLSGLAGPTAGRIAFRYWVTNGGPSGDNSDFIGIDTFSYTSVVPIDAPNDINGDGKSDYLIVRADGPALSEFGANDKTGKDKVGNAEKRNQINAPQVGIGWWTINTDGSGGARRDLGADTDFFQTGDFDGDGKDDLCVWSPGVAGVAAFKILLSSTNTVSVRLFGQSGDDSTVVGDWNADGKDDLAVYRDGTAASPQSYFFWANETTPSSVNYIPWGTDGDIAYALDYDGDGKLDPAVQRNGGGGRGDHWILKSSNGALEYVIYGLSSDFVVPGDYDGDGKDDIVVSRNANFGGGTFKYFWVRETDGGGFPQSPYQWGISGDFICQGDYDGDGKTDIAVWRSNADPTQNYFYVRRSSDSSLQTFEWGASGDYPVNNWNVH